VVPICLSTLRAIYLLSDCRLLAADDLRFFFGMWIPVRVLFDPSVFLPSPQAGFRIRPFHTSFLSHFAHSAPYLFPRLLAYLSSAAKIPLILFCSGGKVSLSCPRRQFISTVVRNKYTYLVLPFRLIEGRFQPSGLHAEEMSMVSASAVPSRRMQQIQSSTGPRRTVISFFDSFPDFVHFGNDRNINSAVRDSSPLSVAILSSVSKGMCHWTRCVRVV
jgi:hypothetical protein